MTEAAFGVELRHSRRAAGLSLRELAARVGYDFSYLSQVERGLRPGSAQLARLCDQALGALGAEASLTAAYRRARPAEPAAAAAKAYRGPNPLEDTRQALASSFGRVPGEAEWLAVVETYAQDVFTTAPADLLPELADDLDLLRHTATSSDRTVAALAGPAARLGVVMARTLAALGRCREARRWWRTARDTADGTGEPRDRLLVRGWEAGTGLHCQRPLPDLLALTDQALAIASTTESAELAGVLAARAQILARLDEATAARQVLEELVQVTAALSADVGGSLFAWPAYRLHHTESFVHTVLGEYEAAYDAQDRAFDLYPQELRGEQAMVQLHRATCLVAEGELNGLSYAMRVLIELPAHCHNELLYDLAARVLTAVRPADLGRSVIRDYRELLLTRPQPRPAC